MQSALNLGTPVFVWFQVYLGKDPTGIPDLLDN